MLAAILAALSTAFSTAALTVAVLALRKRSVPAKRIEAQALEIADLDYRVSSLTKSHKRLNSRVSMASARERLEEDPESTELDTAQRPGETPESWKRRMRAALHKGAANGR